MQTLIRCPNCGSLAIAEIKTSPKPLKCTKCLHRFSFEEVEEK